MKYRVIVKTDYRNRPKDHELSAATLAAQYFETDVIFLRTTCQHTPDLDIEGINWELKSPLGDSKNTIKNNLHTARKQSVNVILDLRRIKMHQTRAISNINYYFSSHHSQIKRLLVITKTGKIIEIL